MRSRTLVVVGVIAALVVLGFLAVLNQSGGPAVYDPGTPQATVQSYFQALTDGQSDDALEFVDPELGCDHNRFGPSVRVSRVVLESVTYSDDGTEASVRVQVTETWGDGLFGPDESTFNTTIHLVETADGWLISDSPWPFFDCRTPEVEG